MDTDLKHILPEKMYELLERAGILTSKEILTLSPWDLKKTTNMTDHDLQLLKNIVANFTCPPIMSADGLKEDIYVSSGCKKLDSILNGGFRKGTLTEIYGESGSGKTQLAMQIAAQCGRGGSVYICTEDIFPVKRFNEISESIHGDHSVKCRNNMYIEHITEAQDLLSCIRVRLPKLLNKSPVQVVIIDSIAAPYRCEDLNYVQRAEELREVAVTLLGAAEKYNLAIICINQVTSAFDESDDVLPSLGLAWSNMITNRLLLKKTSRTINYHGTDLNIRELIIVFNSSLANVVAKLIISKNGLNVV